MILSVAILTLVSLQRIGELVLADRNTRRLKAKGGFEIGASHYSLIVAVHSAWLAGLWFLAWDRPISLILLAVFAGLQLARLWVIASLGGRWTTRIIVLPGAPPVRTGPYRILRHPNYLVVVGEILVLPMAFGLPAFALAFTILNAAVLWIRLRAENPTIDADGWPDGTLRPGPT